MSAPSRFTAILAECAAGALPPNIALMRILAESGEPGEARQALASALDRCEQPGADRIREAMRIWNEHPAAWDTVKAVLGGIDHSATDSDPDRAIARLAAAFDKAARMSPEASVALYSLGSADLLRAATAEIASLLEAEGLTGTDRQCLDLGCGIGRMELALAPLFAAVVGVDISAEMIRIAEERCGHLANVRFAQISGLDLQQWPDGHFDLVLAVDSFPYLMQAGGGLAREMVREAGRILAPGGVLLILNFSYRGHPEADKRDAAEFAGAAGLVVSDVKHPAFQHWDGLAFRLDKPR